MDKRIIEGIEACRPGSEDLQSPEMSNVARQVQHDPEVAQFYERVQQWDAAISAAMDQVSVPSGLADRILLRLRSADSTPDEPEQPAILNGAVVAAALTVDQSSLATSTLSAASVSMGAHDAAGGRAQSTFSRWSRRQWLAAFSTIAAGILVAAFLSTWLPGRADMPLEEIAETWRQQLGPAWHDAQHAPGDFAVPPAILARPAGWQWIVTHGSGRGVAYELQDRTGAKAVLYVVRLSRPELPTAPPLGPQMTTGGKAVGYWQSAGRVYVLVVPGDDRSYRSFINSSPVPLA